MKTCPRCKSTKPLSEFGNCRSKKDGKNVYCKPCHNKKNVEWKQENLEKHKVLSKFATAKLKYGLERQEFESLMEQQDSKCAVCNRTLDVIDDGRNVHVDHCHKTGKVRGLLCGPCNRGLGQYGDDPILLRKAADYLEK